jgi:uncharacterized protein (TIGR02996 family)
MGVFNWLFGRGRSEPDGSYPSKAISVGSVAEEYAWMEQNYPEGFIKAIRASPDDDCIRLIYADWLEERGDPPGEFIRVQVALAHLAEDEDRWAALAAREQLLLGK